MKSVRHRLGAFSLIELLCVVAIIAILAALLLPVLSQGRVRAKQLQCVEQLHQAGLGFASFAHDHNGSFPMAVPISAGGSLEFVQNAYRMQGWFYFSFQHFQALSPELGTPRILACPADRRTPAASFAAFNNHHLSYFVGANAQPAWPNSILSGDRNLTNDWAPPGTMMRFGPNHQLRWTEELHRFKGNLLFADGRVEECKGIGLTVAKRGSQVLQDFILPTLKGAALPGAAPPAVQMASASALAPEGGSNHTGPAAASLRSGGVNSADAVPGQSFAAGSLFSRPAELGGSVTATNMATSNAPEALAGGTTEPPAPPQSSAVPASALALARWWWILLLVLAVLIALEVRRRLRAKSRHTMAGGNTLTALSRSR